MLYRIRYRTSHLICDILYYIVHVLYPIRPPPPPPPPPQSPAAVALKNHRRLIRQLFHDPSVKITMPINKRSAPTNSASICHSTVLSAEYAGSIAFQKFEGKVLISGKSLVGKEVLLESPKIAKVQL